MNETLLRKAVIRAQAERFVVHAPEAPEPAARIEPPASTPNEQLLEILKPAPAFQIGDTVKQIQDVVGAQYNIKRNDLLSIRRTKPLANARQTAMYLAKLLTSLSLPQIGRRFASRDRPRGLDHTTVLHAFRKMERRAATDPNYAAEIETLRAKLREGGMAC